MATILIIEDEEILRDLYSAEFEDEEYHVLTASEGAMGLQLIRRGSIDLVILDLSLPDISGIQVLRTALEEIPELPVVINTAYPIHHNDFSTWSSAAYILKSADLGPLKDAVSRILRRKAGARQGVNNAPLKVEMERAVDPRRLDSISRL
ncbi:MAG: response regulator [Candidatus Eisenbacteria bacterium]|uniref:Response regulator n=1 Tax=Eiseniibacteriota bacterium TaxID=2212470 RepID=A0A948W7P0_UNCEI|nr:response regulator [Candidatus Eisenbacteria bacterium]MBU1947364.1 response regulator [Candidatus Eisenbacteria bacterium]MBU2692455.1 response regulator [Candidatus Eisenbacteria bacterium]